MSTNTIAQTYGLDPNCVEQEFVVGTECECESYGGLKTEQPLWSAVPDHSLRNQGVELISRPLRLEQMLTAFKELHSQYKAIRKDEKFSERCSIHVHVNCLHLETHQVKNIILTYALFEPFFFKMCSPARQENIHCVPLTDTLLPSKYGLKLEAMIESWAKYSALNALPLKAYGTLEFRHMHGHDDYNLFSDWLHIIHNLWRVGQEVVINHKLLTNSDAIRDLYRRIFGVVPDNKFEAIIASPLIDVKLSLVH